MLIHYSKSKVDSDNPWVWDTTQFIPSQGKVLNLNFIISLT